MLEELKSMKNTQAASTGNFTETRESLNDDLMAQRISILAKEVD
jgi:hypothetical protein